RGHVGYDDLDEVVERTADIGSLDDCRNVDDGGFETGQVSRVVALQPDLGVEDQACFERPRIQARAIALDDAGLLQPSDAGEAGAGRESGLFGQGLVGDASVRLERGQNTA